MKRQIFLRAWRYIKQDNLSKSKALKKSWAIAKGTDRTNGILEIWNGNKLKNKGKSNQHHYRRDGRLYVVVRTKMGLEHKLSDVLYKTINNSSCSLTSRMSKYATPSQDVRLTKEHLAYAENNKLTKQIIS